MAASYLGNKTSNMSDFIANLNMAPPAQELPNAPEYNMEEELAMFTNTQFFDFDLGQDANLQPTFDRPATANELKPLDFNLDGDFAFPEFNSFPPQANGFADGIPPLAHPIQTDVSAPYPNSADATSPCSGLISPQTGEKRKAESTSDSRSPAAFDDAARLAAEEDKRRRNTAASARFRIKKKQREQALEQSAKQMSDKMSALEARINQLETENKWLKNLITEKNEKKDDIEVLYKKFSQDAAERKGSERKDGVGTTSA